MTKVRKPVVLRSRRVAISLGDCHTPDAVVREGEAQVWADDFDLNLGFTFSHHRAREGIFGVDMVEVEERLGDGEGGEEAGGVLGDGCWRGGGRSCG